MPLQLTPSVATAEAWKSLANKPFSFEITNLCTGIICLIIAASYSTSIGVQLELRYSDGHLVYSDLTGLIAGHITTSLVVSIMAIALSTRNLYNYAIRTLSPTWTTLCSTTFVGLWTALAWFSAFFAIRSGFTASAGLTNSMTAFAAVAAAVQLIYLMYSGFALRTLYKQNHEQRRHRMGVRLGMPEDNEEAEKGQEDIDKQPEIALNADFHEIGNAEQPTEAETHEILEANDSHSPSTYLSTRSNALIPRGRRGPFPPSELPAEPSRLRSTSA